MGGLATGRGDDGGRGYGDGHGDGRGHSASAGWGDGADTGVAGIEHHALAE